MVAESFRRSAAAWFRGRERREQVLIVIGSVFAAGYLGYAVLYTPLVKWRARALEDIRTYEAITARVAANGANLQTAMTDDPALPDATAITNSSTAVGLVIRRIEPEGSRTAIEMEEADFSVLISWLSVLEEDYGLKVAAIELDRRPVPGVVSARISVER